MPSKEQLKSVGESCSEYSEASLNDVDLRSCESCAHWAGGSEMCDLDIFFEQLTSLDQT